MPRTWNKKYILAASIALFTFIVYLPALRNEFVYWDDNLYIFENPDIRSLDASFLRWAFLDFHVSNWHPLVWLSYAIDYALWGLSPLGYHLTNIILHGLNTYLVVLLVIQLSNAVHDSGFTIRHTPLTLTAAATTGLLFGIHPVHVESVAWVSERKDLLCALFFLLSIMAYVKYAGTQESGVRSQVPEIRSQESGVRSQESEVGNQKSGVRSQKPADSGNTKAGPKKSFINKHYLLSLGFFILALMSKPMAVTLPVVLLILDWYPLGRILSFKTLWAASIEKIPFFALSLASSIITILAQRAGGSITSIEEIPLSIRALVAVKSLIAYLGKMLVPSNLVPFYPYPKDVSWFSLGYLSAAGLVIGITATCMFFVKKQKVWLSVWGYYVITLIPVLGIIQVGSQSMADRYTYLPSVGIYLIMGLIAAWIAGHLLERKKGKMLFVFLGAAVVFLFLLSLSYSTVKQERIWNNSLDLWNYVIEKQPEAVTAYNNRGVIFSTGIQFDKAISDFDNAIALDPSYYRAYNNRGLVYDKMGQHEKAIADYNKAISLSPDYIEAFNNRGLTYDKMGLLDRAMNDFDRAIALNPFYDRAYYNRGRVFNKMNQLDRALADYDTSIELNRDNEEAYNNRGATLFLTGQFTRAIADYDRAISLSPSNIAAYYNRGLAFQKLGQFDKAEQDFDTANLLRLKQQ